MAGGLDFSHGVLYYRKQSKDRPITAFRTATALEEKGCNLMKRWIALLLAAACLFALCACGEDAAQEPTPANENPTPASQGGDDAPETTDSAVSTGDVETDLAWAVGRALCPGFDSLMDRGKYTVDGKECRLYYYVTDGRFAGEVCIAPDGSVYLDREGTLNWQIVTPDGNGNYLTQPLNPNAPQITQSPSGGDDDDEAQATPREDQEVTYTPDPGIQHITPSNTGYVWPVSGYAVITYAYGAGVSDDHRHEGIDIAGSGIEGAPVLAIYDGYVNYIQEDDDGYGLYVTIAHENSDLTFSLYAQLQDVTVSSGDHVSAGDVIGHVGQSGSATGPHLHLGVFSGWDWSSHFDPMDLFPGVSVIYD